MFLGEIMYDQNLTLNFNDKPSGYWEHLTGRIKYRHHHQKQISLGHVPVAFPEPRNKLLKELMAATSLGVTADGKHISLVEYTLNSSVMRELGRLRELTFRSVGEGTLKNRDIDRYDKRYKHIVLWDLEQQDIVGAYRIGEAWRQSKKSRKSSLYTFELFDYHTKFDDKFSCAIELGRSFIQPKYWGKRGLDYLWMGIGAYLKAHAHIRYLFGAVSISNALPDLAKQQIISFYQYYYQPDDAKEYALAKTPFRTDRGLLESHRGQTFNTRFNELKKQLKHQGVSLPTLYKHYSELCEPEGIKFIDFNVDPDFCFCVDGLMLVDLAFIKDKKRQRYL